MEWNAHYSGTQSWLCHILVVCVWASDQRPSGSVFSLYENEANDNPDLPHVKGGDDERMSVIFPGKQENTVQIYGCLNQGSSFVKNRSRLRLA